MARSKVNFIFTLQADTQNLYYVLLFHCNSGYMNAPYITLYVHCLYYFQQSSSTLEELRVFLTGVIFCPSCLAPGARCNVPRYPSSGVPASCLQGIKRMKLRCFELRAVGGCGIAVYPNVLIAIVVRTTVCGLALS